MSLITDMIKDFGNGTTVSIGIVDGRYTIVDSSDDISDVTINDFSCLPTVNPEKEGELWNDNGSLAISRGVQ